MKKINRSVPKCTFLLRHLSIFLCKKSSCASFILNDVAETSLTNDGKSGTASAHVGFPEPFHPRNLCGPWDLARDFVSLRQRDRISHGMSEIPPMRLSKFTPSFAQMVQFFMNRCRTRCRETLQGPNEA